MLSAARDGKESLSVSVTRSSLLALTGGVALGVTLAGGIQPRALAPVSPPAVLEVRGTGGAGPVGPGATVGLAVRVRATFGDKSVACLVDTGADATLLSRTAADGVGLSPQLGTLRLQGVTGATFEGAVHRVP